MIQLFVRDEDWTTVADELIRRAAFVVVFLDEASEGLLRELIVLDELQAHPRTLVVCGDSLPADPGPELDALLARFNRRSGGDLATIEDELETLPA